MLRTSSRAPDVAVRKTPMVAHIAERVDTFNLLASIELACIALTIALLAAAFITVSPSMLISEPLI